MAENTVVDVSVDYAEQGFVVHFTEGRREFIKEPTAYVLLKRKPTVIEQVHSWLVANPLKVQAAVALAAVYAPPQVVAFLRVFFA